MVAGRDPRDGMGGHSSYVLAHALAAHRAGFRPPGLLSRIHRSRPRPSYRRFTGSRSAVFGPDPANGFWKRLVALSAPAVSAGVERFLAGRPGPHLVHGFGTYALRGRRDGPAPGSRPASGRRPSAGDVHAGGARVRVPRPGSARPRRLDARARYRAELWWARWFVAPCERLAHQRSDLLTMNYESSRGGCSSPPTARAPSRKLPYASKAAFADDGPGDPAGRGPFRGCRTARRP